jgi:hypothetical protein
MDYKKNIIDSIYLSKKVFSGKFYGNDTIVIMGQPDTFDSINCVLMDTNLNVLNEYTIESPYHPFFINDVQVFKDRVMLFGNLLDNSYVFSLSYEGELIDSLITGNGYTFSCKLSDSTFYYAVDQGGIPAEIKVYKMDTSFNILSLDTMPEYGIGNGFYIEHFNNKLVVSGTYTHNTESGYYIGVGIFDMKFDSTYAFDYFNLGAIDVYPSGIAVTGNNIYVANYLNLTENTTYCIDSICITRYDSLLHVKWRKIIGGDNNYHVVKIFPAPNGGCVFSMTIHDLVSDTYDGAIVWLDIAGNQVLSIPKNISVFNKAIIYPNPGQNELNITLPENYTETVFELYNATGVLCRQTKFNTENQNINTTALSQGIYLYRILQNGKVISSGKWVKNE